MDVSKAIDKLDATEARRARQLRFTEWMRGTGLAASRIDEITGTNMGSHYTTAASQPAVPTRDHLEKLRPHLNCEVPRWIEQMVDDRTIESENFRMRDVVAVAMGTDTRRSRPGIPLQDCMAKHEYSITAPATDAARQWSGWGTALKPAFEPALLFRKPLVGTVAENVMAHGTGALNIDGCRVPHAGQGDEAGYRDKCASVVGLGSNRNGNAYGEWTGERQDSASALGRFPANVIHDGSPEVLAHFPDSNGAGPSLPRVKVTGYGGGIGSGESAYLGGERIPFNAGSGSAARFFYCPKANRKDRNEGCEGLPQRVVSTWGGDEDDLSEGKKSTFPKGNHHPTVKPTDLMRYLCRLVTPPGGVVLDPFTGSGSTGKAAMLEGFRFVGCELSDEYADIAEARIRHAAELAQAASSKPSDITPTTGDLFEAA